MTISELKERIRKGSNNACEYINIPLRYRKLGMYESVLSKKALNACLDNNTVYLTGSCGSGKTHLACYLALSYFAESFCEKEYEDGSYYEPTKSVDFIIMPQLLTSIKRSWEDKQAWKSDSTEEQIMNRCTKKHLLVIDDIAANKLSDWSRDVVYNIINERYLNMRPTIITSNLTLSELSAQLDDRIASRIADGVIIDMGEKDYRLK